MSGKRIAIVQSSYIPWKGYFDLIRAVDEFILLDDVQFTRRDWRSRNRIKSPHGPIWLTIPVNNKGRYTQAIQEVTVVDHEWAARHWQAIRGSYLKAPFFCAYADRLEALFTNCRHERLSAVNHAFIVAICELLGISTKLSWSSDYTPRHGRMDRLIDLCRATGASEYLSGPTARDYIDLETFEAAGIRARFADYSGYPEYPQPHAPFDHQVSVLDLLLCTGPRAIDYMKAL
jgi:WbqC-like protein family